MKIIVMIIMLCSALVAEIEVKALGTGYVDNIAGSYNTDKSIELEASIDKYVPISDSFAVYGKVSNRLNDTPLDKVYLEYAYRCTLGSTVAKVGTITTFKGVFDRTLNSSKRIPIIYLPSGVYNDEWMSGFLDTVLGGSVEHMHLVGSVLVTGKVVVGVPRAIDNSKIEAGGFNYESEFSDVDVSRKFESGTLKVEYMDYVELFMSRAIGGFKIVDVSGMTDLDKYLYVLGSGDDYDRSVVLSGKEFTYRINRIGGIVRFNDITITYEQFNMLLETSGYNKFSKGRYIYVNKAIGDYTPYVSIGESVSSHTAKEAIAGLKIDVGNDTSVLMEYRESDWVQTKDLAEYTEWKYDGRPKAKVVLIEVIRTW